MSSKGNRNGLGGEMCFPCLLWYLQTQYTMGDLFIPGILTVPSGVYMQVAQKNGLYFKAEYTKDYIVVDEDKKTTSPHLHIRFKY